MKRILPIISLSLMAMGRCPAGQPALTIYNQNFAVVRDSVPMDLKAGVNQVRFTGTTVQIEPNSVILRDPAGKHSLRILEQNCRADALSQELLLSLFEGKTIEFETEGNVNGKAERQIVKGKIVRSGYVPHYSAFGAYGPVYAQNQMGYAYGAGANQPIIEVDGKLRFSLPGQPLFPQLGDDTILKPTLVWLVESDQPGQFDAELSYVTGGMNWQADYNVTAPEKGDLLDLTGWVTMDNQSGKSFENAKIKLMAGDVNKIQQRGMLQANMGFGGGLGGAGFATPPVTEKTFDEYHLYSLEHPATLLDRETKQVEFVRASGIASTQLYIYDGVKIDDRYRGWDFSSIRNQPEYGTESNPKVWVMREFRNAESNHLGMPLPKGRVRFYRRDEGGQVEFTGENEIDHTPKDELVRLYTGNAFDLMGERRQTNFHVDAPGWNADESFEIVVRNHKENPAEIRIVEHLYRWSNWKITAHSKDFRKTDAQTIEFPVTVAPGGEQTVTYNVHYSWSSGGDAALPAVEDPGH